MQKYPFLSLLQSQGLLAVFLSTIYKAPLLYFIINIYFSLILHLHAPPEQLIFGQQFCIFICISFQHSKNVSKISN